MELYGDKSDKAHKQNSTNPLNRERAQSYIHIPSSMILNTSTSKCIIIKYET